jgi:hypothetical protein
LLAKEGIRKSLSKSNIISELFSPFTSRSTTQILISHRSFSSDTFLLFEISRYQEIIELEVNFLVENFTPDVARQLDETLQMIVLGTKPHSFRILAFTMRRLRGDSTEVAWAALESVSDSTPSSASGLPKTSKALDNGPEASATQESLGDSGSYPGIAVDATSSPIPPSSSLGDAGPSVEPWESAKPQVPADKSDYWFNKAKKTKLRRK